MQRYKKIQETIFEIKNNDNNKNLFNFRMWAENCFV